LLSCEEGIGKRRRELIILYWKSWFEILSIHPRGEIGLAGRCVKSELRLEILV
jgi:hypothetical protein